jgi:hypothetical protein
MRGRLSIALMVFVALSLVLSLVAAVAPNASAQDGTIIPGGPTGGLNKWIRHDLPTTQHWQMAPNTDIWDLESADDGTLFALVEDTSGPIDMILGGAPATTWDGLRWAVFPAYSDVALFKSTDGGYEWKLVWHQPASDVGAPLAVIPQPGYIDGDSANDAVFVATGSRYLPTRGTWVGGQWLGDIYRSLDGGNTFTRVTPRCPAVTIGGPGGSGTITSMDVAEDRTAAGQFVVVVGVMGAGGGGAFNNGNAEGVYTWNEGGDGDWEDKQIANSLPPAPYPGTLPAGNGIHAMQVMFSPGWLENGQIVAVAVDRLGFGGAPMSASTTRPTGRGVVTSIPRPMWQ